MCDFRPFQQAIAFNKYATSLIEQANHKEALAALSKVLIRQCGTLVRIFIAAKSLTKIFHLRVDAAAWIS
jgi:hypothetical protein